MSDTITPPTEEHIALPPSMRTEQDAAFIKADYTFQGKKLFPYTEGVRLLLSSLSGGTISNDYWLLILLLLLTDLQERYEKAKEAAGIKRPLMPEEEDAFTEEVVGQVLTTIGDKPDVYRAKVFTLANKLKRESKSLDLGFTEPTDGSKPKRITLVDKAINLALEIYKEAEMSETIPAETGLEGAPPK